MDFQEHLTQVQEHTSVSGTKERKKEGKNKSSVTIHCYTQFHARSHGKFFTLLPK